MKNPESSRSITRRQFVRGTGKAALGLAVLSQTALLAGCGTSQNSEGGIWGDLTRRLRGRLVRPGDTGYRKLYLPYNRRYVDTKPQGIAMCLDASDVSEAVKWAREHEMPVAIRSGGHNYAGYSTTDGLLINLGRMKSVEVNDDTGRAKVQVGAQNVDVYRELQPHEVSISAGRCPTVAIGGLVLGGGVGFSTRKLGLTCDSLVETEIVTADGEILTCNENENEDLFWASRGGSGGNFGVNVSYTLQAAPVSDVSIYDLKWGLEDGEKVLPALQEISLSAPDDFSCRMGGGRPGVEGSGGRGDAFVNVLGQFFGPKKDLLEILDPVLSIAKPSSQTIEDMTFWEAKDYFFHNTPTDRFQLKSAYITDELPEEGIDVMLRNIADWPGSTTKDGAGFAMFALGGAVSRVPKEATAYVHRDANFLMAWDSSWKTGDSDDVEKENVAWVEGIADEIQPFTNGHAYQNFIDRSQRDFANAYYGSNLKRLEEIKADRDPDNFFSFKQSVPLR